MNDFFLNNCIILFDSQIVSLWKRTDIFDSQVCYPLWTWTDNLEANIGQIHTHTRQFCMKRRLRFIKKSFPWMIVYASIAYCCFVFRFIFYCLDFFVFPFRFIIRTFLETFLSIVFWLFCIVFVCMWLWMTLELLSKLSLLYIVLKQIRFCLLAPPLLLQLTNVICTYSRTAY